VKVPTPRARRALVFVLFFLSGAAGLVYQVVWSRLLNQVFGVSAHAVTAVLAAFLGGLALGGWALGRVADRVRDPLRLYGFLELGIGATALAGTWVVRSFVPLNAWFATRLAPDSIGLLCIRALLASAVVLPPTFLMGGTLPAITRAFVDRIGSLGRELPLLYALNTSGAVAGSLAAGFVLIRAIGVHPTLGVAVAANLAVGALALRLAAVGGERGGETEPVVAAPISEEPEPAPRAEGSGLWLLTAMALSGVASLALEVIWTRVLVLVVGTSTYAFVTMLATFLVGIALGSFLARALADRIRDPRRVFGWVQLGIAASTLASIPLSAALVASTQEWFDGMELRWGALLAGRFGASFLVMIVPTTLIGMTFPLAGRMWARRLGALGGQLGQVYGANTLGNIVGALAGGFLVLPRFGLQRGIALLAILNLACAGWALLPVREGRRRLTLALRAAPLSLGLLACAVLVAVWQPRPFASSAEREADTVLYYREGLVSTVKVIRRADDGRQLLMLVDGVVIGQSSAGVDRKQQVLAHFPFLLQPGRPPASILTIGLGTGILTGEVVRHAGVERVEVVELEPAVIEGARAFEGWNDGALSSPLVRVMNDDGVNFLRRSQERYDAVISDGKSRSGHAGNALFYSEDYYRSARRHLAAGGLMIQWVPLDVPGEDFRTIVRTFAGVFPYVYMWLGPESCFLVGRKQPLILDREHMQRVLDEPATASLRRHGWRTAEDVASLLVADGASLRDWLAREGTVNSLERPVLEFYALRAAAQPATWRVAENLEAIAATRRGALAQARLAGFDAAAIEAGARSAIRLVDLLAALGRGDGDAAVGVGLVEQALAEAPARDALGQWAALAVHEVALALDRSGRSGDAIGLYRRALDAWPDFTEARVNLGRVLAAQGRAGEAVGELRLALTTNPDSGAAHRILGKVLEAAGDHAGAAAESREVLRIAPGDADAHDDLGLALSLTGEVDEALAEFLEAVRLKPAWPLPMGRAALLLALNPNPAARDVAQAIRLARRAVELSRSRDASALEVLAAAYAAADDFEDAVAEEEKVVELANASGDRDLATAARAAAAGYRNGKALPMDIPSTGRSASP
jgi:spermidine synthase